MLTNNAKDKPIRVSEEMRDKLQKLKKDFRFSNIDEVLKFLMNEKKSDIDNFIQVREKEKTLQTLEAEIYKRVESTHKRLGSYEKIYFKEISNFKFLFDDFTKEVLKNIEQKNQTTSIVEAKKIKEEQTEKAIDNSDTHNKLVSENVEYVKKIGLLNDKLKEIKSLFELKSGAFSSAYEARIKKEVFDQIFNL